MPASLGLTCLRRSALRLIILIEALVGKMMKSKENSVGPIDLLLRLVIKFQKDIGPPWADPFLESLRKLRAPMIVGLGPTATIAAKESAAVLRRITRPCHSLFLERAGSPKDGELIGRGYGEGQGDGLAVVLLRR